MHIPEFDEIIEPNDQTIARREHLDALRELVGNVYPNRFERSKVTGTEDTITNVLHFAPVVEIVNDIKAVVAKLAERERPPVEIKDALNARLKEFGSVRISGRLTTPPRGNFVHLTDGINKLQVYAKKGTFALVKNDGKDTLDEENGWTAWELLDHGDFIGVEGYLFITNTGELSVHVEKLQFLAKAMLPMPDKMHGIADAEIRQRQRYYDLIGSSLQVEHEGMTTREVFETRAKVISSMRHFLEDHGYIEVETPMLTPKATGAAAKPFKTHHNALDIDLYARIAPELYLKRLVVGGFEKVYELNRNFRNEGISYKHNPEFTMLEFYCAYMDVNGMMDFCEELIKESVRRANNDNLTIKYTNRFERVTPTLKGQSRKPATLVELGDIALDFSSFQRKTMIEAIWEVLPLPISERIRGDFESWVRNGANAWNLQFFWLWLFEDTDWLVEGSYDDPDLERIRGKSPTEQKEIFDRAWKEHFFVRLGRKPKTLGDIDSDIVQLFEIFAERKLATDADSGVCHPTFIVDYPKSISPLSKASPANPNIAERFELFINGMEIANGFSELNDPREQYERFAEQSAIREGGDEEAMVLDEDYIRALSYGMPPAAGIGIGIDRLVMLLTNKHSIRDVILFPHMRPERPSPE